MSGFSPARLVCYAMAFPIGERQPSQALVPVADNSLSIRDESFLAQRLDAAPSVDIYGIAV